MPNWCVGTLKVRGEKENMKRFLLEAFTPIVPAILTVIKGVQPPTKVVNEDEWSVNLSAEGQCDGFHVKGTHRNFVDSKSIEWELDREVLLISSYQAAWGIDTEGLRNLSEEYQVDLKIYGFERGMEYNIDFEVHKGEIIKCDEIKFNNYDWECIDPELGG